MRRVRPPTVTPGRPTVRPPTVTPGRPTVRPPTVTPGRPTVRPPAVTLVRPTVRPPTVTPARPTVTPARPTVTPARPTVTPARPTVTPARPTVRPPTVTPHAGQLLRDDVIGIMDLPLELQYLIVDNMDYGTLKYFSRISDNPHVVHYIEETMKKRLDIYRDIIEHYIRYQDIESWHIIENELLATIDLDKIKFLMDNYHNEGYMTIRGRPKVVLTDKIIKDYILPNADYDILKYMEDNGINVVKLATSDTRWMRSSDILIREAGRGNLDLFRFLVDKGVDVKHYDILDNAVISGNLELVKLLVNHGADIIYTDSIIYNAVLSGNIELVDWVADNGTSINHPGAVRNAILMRREDILRWFHNKGVNILYAKVIDYIHENGLSGAGFGSKDELVRWLRDIIR